MEKELNLELLKNEYRNKGKALKGFKLLNNLIKSDQGKNKLQNLLRSHINNPIGTFEEVIQRNDIDYLLGYYSIIEVGVIAGYISLSLDKKLKNEIKKILGDEFVKRFYVDFYPLLLPQVLFEQVINEQKPKRIINDYNTALFQEFLLLDHYMQADNDILTFLAFLDDQGKYGRNGEIFDFNSVLDLIKDKRELKRRFRKIRKKDPLDEGFRGFLKYVNFISNYKVLLDKTEDDLLKSAFWHYQYYWFNLLKKKFSNVVDEAFKNLTELVDSIEAKEYDSGYGTSDSESSTKDYEDDYDDWKEESISMISKAKKDIFEIVNNSYAIPLQIYLSEIVERK